MTQRYKKKELVDKSGISGFIDNSNLDKEIATPAEKTELKSNQNKITKSEAFDSNYFRDKSHYEDDYLGVSTILTGLFGYLYDFNVDYDVIAFDNILNIYKYLMKKHDIK